VDNFFIRIYKNQLWKTFDFILDFRFLILDFAASWVYYWLIKAISLFNAFDNRH